LQAEPFRSTLVRAPIRLRTCAGEDPVESHRAQLMLDLAHLQVCILHDKSNSRVCTRMTVRIRMHRYQLGTISLHRNRPLMCRHSMHIIYACISSRRMHTCLCDHACMRFTYMYIGLHVHACICCISPHKRKHAWTHELMCRWLHWHTCARAASSKSSRSRGKRSRMSRTSVATKRWNSAFTGLVACLA
jgi:hypothetical protein